ncbi:MAG: heme exporter protein CcmD [Litorivicinus sp.]
MAFESFSEFLAMGRHGVYVWSSFGIACACFIGLAIEDRVARARAIKRIQQQLRRENA